MSEIIITAQHIALLDIIGRGEAVNGANPYITLWPSSTESSLVQMTLAEVSRFQLSRIKEKFKSNAVGRYQFVRKDLEQSVKDLGLSATEIKFTAGIQDALMIDRLKKVRKLEEWLGKSLKSDKFMIQLAQEFASIPVPYPMTGYYRAVTKGESYYSDDELNNTKHDPDTLYQELEDILELAPGAAKNVSTSPTGLNGVTAAIGSSPKSQTASTAAGVGVGAFSGGNAGARPLPANKLPSVGNVYDYKLIDPLDDRYDFRTGHSVKDMLIYGTGAAAASPVINGNIGPAKVAITNSGAVPPGGTADITDESSVSSALTGNKDQTAPGGKGASYAAASTKEDRTEEPRTQINKQMSPEPVTKKPK